MATTSTKKNARKPWHGFAIEIGPNTDLGGEGLLMYEYASSGYTPVGRSARPTRRRRSLQATSPRPPDTSGFGRAGSMASTSWSRWSSTDGANSSAQRPARARPEQAGLRK